MNQPIVLTIVTLLIGSYLLNAITERRARRDKLRDKAIDFITEAGNTINRFVPHIYSQLRTDNLAFDQAIQDGLKDLFAKRMGIQVGGQAYLKTDEFHQLYFRLLDEIVGVVNCISELERGSDAEKIVQEVRASRDLLRDSWPLEDESLGSAAGRPVDELILWTDTIMHRTTHLLVSYLESVMR
jgi:hypothetical protein